MTFDTTTHGDDAMADGEDDDIPANASRDLLMGDLRGRMRAQEARVNRLETWVGDKFTIVDKKVDAVDGKLDQIIETLASQAGARAFLKFFMQPAVVILGAICSIAGALLLHLLRVN